MNTNVRRLIDQFTNNLINNTPLDVREYDPFLKEAEKLVVQLVEECAALCEDNGDTYKYSHTPSKAQLAESTSKHCGTLIKRNFGLEK